MLLNLHVINLALIKEVDVDFTNGLLVLTGETGAGKSLILGSVNIALGNKASKELIRTGTDYSLVELTFSVSEKCAEHLKKYDIYMENDNIITVTRKISEGRSVSKINGETVNLNTLKNVMSMLVDIHGQHDHQSLLYTENHLSILDKFARDSVDELLNQIKVEFDKFTKLKNRLKDYDTDDAKRARELEFANYEVNEIESAHLMVNEDVELELEYKKLSNGQAIVSNLSEIYNYLSTESNGSVGDILNRVIADINHISGIDSKIDEFQKILYDLDSMCRDITSEIYDYTEDMQYNPERIREVEERLDIINHLKLKYGQSIEQIFQYRDEKQEYIDRLNNYENEIAQLNYEIIATENQLIRLCDELSEKRAIAAKELEILVKQALIDLNFLSVEFKISLSKKNVFTEKGQDYVEFLISTNPGEPVKPLAKVASGGELSRIMLAIKSILAKEDEIDTLIFDEIDTGISGKTAQMVAEKLAKISRNHQVLCISHLAQIAAMADGHYLIEKKAEDNSTITNIVKLDRNQSIEELIRINGGGEVTEAAMIHATEMKDMADRTKCNLS